MATPVYNQTPFVGNRPMGRKDAQGNIIPKSFEWLAYQADYTTPTAVYIGYARPGSATSASVWQIALYTYNMSSELTSITWAQNPASIATSEFEFIWDDRADYTYS